MPGIVEVTQTNKREDISDMMIMGRTEETPFLAIAAKGAEAQNTTTEWPVDLPVAPRTAGVPDDQDATNFQNFSPDRTRIKGVVQIFERLPKVSRLANKVSNVAGVGKGQEFSKQVLKAMDAVALDMETRFLSGDDSDDESTGTAYETRGMGSWTQSTAQSHLPVPANYRPDAGQIYGSDTLTNLEENDLKAMLQARWAKTRKKGTLRAFVGPDFKSKVDLWSYYAPTVSNNTFVRNVNNNVTDRRITQVVDYLNTSFGNVEMYLHPYILFDGADTESTATPLGALLIDMDAVEIGFNERPTKNPLPDLGSGPRAQISAIAVLRNKNPMAHCKVAPTG